MCLDRGIWQTEGRAHGDERARRAGHEAKWLWDTFRAEKQQVSGNGTVAQADFQGALQLAGTQEDLAEHSGKLR